jgi:hypothetical protein
MVLGGAGSFQTLISRNIIGGASSNETTQLNDHLGPAFLVIDRAVNDLIAADMLTGIMTTLRAG